MTILKLETWLPKCCYAHFYLDSCIPGSDESDHDFSCSHITVMGPEGERIKTFLPHQWQFKAILNNKKVNEYILDHVDDYLWNYAER